MKVSSKDSDKNVDMKPQTGNNAYVYQLAKNTMEYYRLIRIEMESKNEKSLLSNAKAKETNLSVVTTSRGEVIRKGHNFLWYPERAEFHLTCW